jgi:hypothetical protein
MDDAALERIFAAFRADMRRIFREKQDHSRSGKGSKSAVEANSKFQGFTGKFATIEEFHAGAEETLQLGVPNPDLEKGIENDLTRHPSTSRVFVPPNYLIATTMQIEHCFAVNPKDPPEEVKRKLAKMRAKRVEPRPAAPAADSQGNGQGRGTARDGDETAEQPVDVQQVPAALRPREMPK